MLEGACLTAGDALFLPGEKTIWDAYWLLDGREGLPGLYEAHLIEDVWSPSGYCFGCDAFRLGDDRSWEWAGGDRFWDYSSADQLLSECPIDFRRSVPLDAEEYRAFWESGELYDECVTSVLQSCCWRLLG